MRLIDADLLKRRCVNAFIEDDDFLNLIEEAPTAYNPEKVVEQLVENFKYKCEYKNECISEMCEIVKAGGVNE